MTDYGFSDVAKHEYPQGFSVPGGRCKTNWGECKKGWYPNGTDRVVVFFIRDDGQKIRLTLYRRTPFDILPVETVTKVFLLSLYFFAKIFSFLYPSGTRFSERRSGDFSNQTRLWNCSEMSFCCRASSDAMTHILADFVRS